jgi:hypothetical protein
MAVAHGGQTVCSQVTAGLADQGGLRSLGEHRLRDLGGAEQIFQVGGGVFPPLRSVDVVPPVRSELIGRSDDIAALSVLVAQQRLVTLTGVVKAPEAIAGRCYRQPCRCSAVSPPRSP